MATVGRRKAAKPKKTKRELIFLKSREDLATPEQREAFTDDLTDYVLELVQAERKRQGKPPLK